MNFTAGKARFEEGWFRTAWKRGGGEVGSGGQGGLLSCQALRVGSCKHALANTLHEDWQPTIWEDVQFQFADYPSTTCER